MALQQINVGTTPNDNTGDTLRAAFVKVNANTTDLLLSITTSEDSTFNGVKVGRGPANISTNTAIGNLALNSNYAGYQNAAIGGQSLLSNGNGFSNTGIGFLSLSNNTGFSNCTGVGFNTQVTSDNQVQLGNASTTTFVYGTVQNRSDLRDKSDVRNTVLGLDFISKLRPVDYKWDMREDYKSEMPIQAGLLDEDFKTIMDLWIEENKLVNLENDGSKKRNRYHHGFIAQEVRDLGVDFGGFQDHSINGGDDVLSIGYDEFIAPMIKAIQELKAEIELLKAK